MSNIYGESLGGVITVDADGKVQIDDDVIISGDLTVQDITADSITIGGVGLASDSISNPDDGLTSVTTSNADTIEHKINTSTKILTDATNTTFSHPIAMGGNTITSTGRIGVGVAVPLGGLHIMSNEDEVGLQTISELYASSATDFPSMKHFKARGTSSAPLAVADTHVLGQLLWNGHDGTSFIETSEIRCMATEDFTGAGTGSCMSLQTTPIGATSAEECLRLEGTDAYIPGNLGVGTLATATDKVIISDTPTDASGTLKALAVGMTVSAAGNKSGSRSGIVSTANLSSTGDHNMTLVAYSADGGYSGGDSLASMVTFEGRMINSGTGTIASNYGLKVDTGNLLSGTINDNYGVYCSISNGAGIIDRCYGLYIDDMKASTVSHGIYQVGEFDLNHFRGNVGIGTVTDPIHKLHIKTIADPLASVFPNYTETELVLAAARAASHYNHKTDLKLTGSGAMNGTCINSDNTITVSSTGGTSGVINQNLATVFTAGGTTTSAIASNITTVMSGGGTLNDSYGVYVNTLSAGGTIDTAYGLFVNDLEAKTSYGVYLNEPLLGTTKWGVYQLGADSNNYFAGRVGIGVVPTIKTLEVLDTTTEIGAAIDGTVISQSFTPSGVATNLVRNMFVKQTLSGGNAYTGFRNNILATQINNSTVASSSQVNIYAFGTHNTPTLTLGNLVGFQSYGACGSTGTITDLKHFNAVAPVPGTGSITRSYGVYVEDQSAAVTGYGIYQSGANNINVFQGARMSLPNLPVSATGLSAGDIWNNGGVLNIV